MWGAEFDDSNRIKAVYVTNTDDQEEEGILGMQRYRVNNVDGNVRITTSASNNNGPAIQGLQTLSLGKSYWNTFLEKIRNVK